MGLYNPPVKAQAWTGQVCLQDTANPGSFKVNPTLNVGDVKVMQDGGALANINTLPTVSPASSVWVLLALTSTEMTGNNIGIQFISQTSPKPWADLTINIQTT